MSSLPALWSWHHYFPFYSESLRTIEQKPEVQIFHTKRTVVINKTHFHERMLKITFNHGARARALHSLA